MAIDPLPLEPPGEGAKNKLKHRLKHMYVAALWRPIRLRNVLRVARIPEPPRIKRGVWGEAPPQEGPLNKFKKSSPAAL